MQHIPILYGGIFLQLVLAAKLIYDLTLWFRRERKGTGTKTVHHAKEWIVVAVASVPTVWNLAAHLQLLWYLSWLLAGSICLLYLWIMIDGLYNVFRGFKWPYTGSVDKDDAKSDIFLRRLPVWLQQAVKWVPFAGLIILYILNFKPC